MVIRSFEVNNPGMTIDQLEGGVVGGSVLRGVLKVGDEIEMRPGFVKKDPKTGESTCTPIKSTVISLKTEENKLLFAVPGGLIGVGLNIDPYLSRADKLVGQVMGYVNELPPVFSVLEIQYHLLQRLVGVKSTANDSGSNKVRKIERDEKLMINVGSCSIGCRIADRDSNTSMITVELAQPVCTSVGEKVALSRSINRKLRLIGWGNIIKGKT